MAASGKAWILGSSGLSLADEEAVAAAAKTIPVVYASNFSAGVNLVLALFNLLPIPPLDGGRIAVGLLPAAAAQRWAGLERYGIVIVLLLMFILPEMSRDLGHRIDPVRDLLDEVLPRARNLILILSGNGIDD